MQSLSRESIVDQMVSQLAERRHAAIGRRSAYLALARAILTEEPTERHSRRDIESAPTTLGEPARAA
jgi:hypothetical protein